MKKDKCIKIAFVQDDFPDEQHGIYTHTYNLASKLRLDSHICCVDVIKPNTKSLKKRKSSLTSYIAPSIIRTTIDLMNDIKKRKYDIVHIHGTHVPLALIPLVKNEKKYKLVITLHGIVAIDSKHSIKNRLLLKNVLFGFIEKVAINKADAVIAVSPAIEKIALDKGVKKENIYVIPNGINLKSLDCVGPSLNLKSPSILFAGRLVKAKNVENLINAVMVLKKDVPKIHLYIAGNGPQLCKLKEHVSELNLQDNVTFLGYIHGDVKDQYYRSIDICVVPSTFESFSLVALEAMAYGKPVIASNVGGLPYLVDEGTTGYLFDPNNYQDIAQKINQIIHNKERMIKFGNAGRKKAENYEWSNVATDTIDAYRKILDDQT
jgi:glycosyltransferase involved in cell wall biosynthesis